MALETWKGRTATQTDGNSPLDETLLDGIRKDLDHLRQVLYGSTEPSFHTPSWGHKHNGTDSPYITDVAANVISNNNLFNAATGSLLYHSNNAEASDSSSVLQKKREITLVKAGSYTVKFDIKVSGTNTTAYGQLRLNGTNEGVEQSTTSTSYVTKSVDIGPTVAGDTIELWIRTASGSPDTEVQNFRLYVDTLLDTPKNTL